MTTPSLDADATDDGKTLARTTAETLALMRDFANRLGAVMGQTLTIPKALDGPPRIDRRDPPTRPTAVKALGETSSSADRRAPKRLAVPASGNATPSDASALRLPELGLGEWRSGLEAPSRAGAPATVRSAPGPVVAPQVHNRFDVTVQAPPPDPKDMARQITDHLDLEYKRRTTVSITEALHNVGAALRRQGAG